MEGDFTRNSDEPEARYSGVLMQQGRVQLDADWNEQWLIQTRALRSALRDLIGPHAGPSDDFGFQIIKPGPAGNQATLKIGTGAYYVDGIRCEQRDAGATLIMPQREEIAHCLVFLEVWERHVNAIEDPRIREIALLGPDTATRAEVVWRVRLLAYDANTQPNNEDAADVADALVQSKLRPPPERQLRLAAHAQTTSTNTDPCLLSPLARYRGRENQLYRVQIHDARPTDDSETDPVLFTFKWSRDNGSVVFPILPIKIPSAPATAGDKEIVVTVKVGNLGRDERYGLVANDIVEFVDDQVTRESLHDTDTTEVVKNGPDPGHPGLLGRVLSPIDPDDLTVRIAVYAPDRALVPEISLHPYLRRWDQRDTAERKLHLGAIPVRRSELLNNKWLPLEDGVEVLFQSEWKEGQLLASRAGEYWMIPARTATGEVLWPTIKTAGGERAPRHVLPHGPERHYAPLALLSWNGSAVTLFFGVRKKFSPFTSNE